MSGNSYEHGYSDRVKEATQTQPTQRIAEDYGPCWQCGGQGGFFQRGTTDLSPCSRCSGTGQIVVRRTVGVTK